MSDSQPSAALSDLAFLLIIYFIVIAGFNVNKGFLMNLPAKDSTRFLLKEDILRYELDENGDILFRGEKTSSAQAEKDLSLAVTRRPNLAVLLEVSPKAPWQQVVSFVELAKKLRIDSFSFKMTSEEQNIKS
ncbi:MAG: biopolymer transporter ExbD [Spirochaetaceae bacterium]|jgi:biopolymer transport protein ExbD|nr:biopolymer transporter ExbD [Spirochaetaceae bacterium]